MKNFCQNIITHDISSLIWKGVERINKNNFKHLYVPYSKIKEETIVLNNSVYSIPHKKKRDKGGEDAHLELENLLVIADGVGAWNSLGYDPREYAMSLCENIKQIFLKNNDVESIIKDPKKLLIEAAGKTKVIGSSTCSLIMLDKAKKKIKSAYLGDSLYMITRYSVEEKKFVKFFKAEEQVHRFNQPYQVGTYGDDPDKAIVSSHDVEDMDVIILASDGLWDNLEDDAIVELLNHSQSDGFIKIKDNYIAKIIAKTAEEKSNDITFESPFAKRAKQNGFFHFKGGKQDDITVIISQIIYENGEMTKVESSYKIENILQFEKMI